MDLLGLVFTLERGFIASTNNEAKKLYSNKRTPYGVNPYWVTGFSDAESSFSIRISKDEKRYKSIRIAPIFFIELDKKESFLLKKIQDFFDAGTIINRVRKGKPSVIYSVQSIKTLKNIIIPHFNQYNLLTTKKDDFNFFSKVVDILVTKQHKTEQEINEILSLKASMKKGLSNTLMNMFPGVIKVPPYPPSGTGGINQKGSVHYINPLWITGFVDGGGCFYVKISKTSTKINVFFSISQHIREIDLIKKIMQYLDCGVIKTVKTRPNQLCLVVYGFDDIMHKIIPFFNIYNLYGTKKLDYYNFREIANILAEKKHVILEKRLLDKIKLIEKNMNRNRKL